MTPPPVVDPEVDTVLVVDVQRAVVTGTGAVPGAEALLATLTAVLADARRAGASVVHVQNDGPPGAPDEPGTGGWEPALAVEHGEPVVRKTADDPFTGTDLAALLGSHDSRCVAVVGVQSEMCVAAAARGLLARGLSVVLPRDGHATYAIPEQGAHAPSVPATLVARVAEWSLGDGVVLVDRAAGIRFAERPR